MEDFLKGDYSSLLKELGKEKWLELFDQMLLIRNFETRAESAYLQGKIGGFFHSYIGQEAVQIAAVEALGPKNWYITSYRCHALALLLGVSPESIMKELYGKADGNALGRGGSMHLYADRLLGGFGIVGGQTPIAAGAAFTIKYKKQKDEVAICFLGDGAVAQGAFHESLNLASLWDLPCIYVIENNQWGMGTAVNRAIVGKRLAEERAPAYQMEAFTLDGMNILRTLAGFKALHRYVLEKGRPVIVEVITERFKGHSISDPGLYRSKEELTECMKRDPLIILRGLLEESGYLTEEEFKTRDKAMRETMVAAMKAADAAPLPNPAVLEEGVFA